MSHSEIYLAATQFIDTTHPDLQAFVAAHSHPQDSLRQQACDLYYAVRDHVRYNPYAFRPTQAHFLASHTLTQGEGYCVAKAVAYTACARAVGIPARLGFADVKNHLCTERLLALLGGNVFRLHGYSELYIEGQWVKATPVFNLSLCERFGVKPLDFDGRQDAIFHAFNAEGAQHMEYLHDYGHYADLPFDFILEQYRQHYPNLMQYAQGLMDTHTDFEAEAAEEQARQ